MSWDEKDWAYTWITGKRCRLKLLFRDFDTYKVSESEEEEICYTIREYDRNVYEFSILSENEMDKTAQDYGIMIEYQYLGHNRYRFDYREKDCIISNINLKKTGPFSSSLRIHSSLTMFGKLNIDIFKSDLNKIELFLQSIKKKNVNNKINLETQILKKQGEIIVKSIKRDLITFKNINNDYNCYFYTFITGKLTRLNSLFRVREKDIYSFNNDDKEVEAIFFAKNLSYMEKSEDELQIINEIAKTYCICIKIGFYIYDYRDEICNLNNIDIKEQSPLNDINIGKYISTYSTFEY
ncbi:hypothetical protein [uncultured Bacteroides sp.]|uniref:hypothetical protein n=1 Tax=uncultured Bacteroides sp. TaxID=162156 RepID=UPI00260EAE34|nr:hypothetical protein [uncultured Bacteroides sp.]